MAPNLASFPNEILVSILGYFCLHCSGEHDYDAPDGYFRACRGGVEAGEDGGSQVAGSPSWFSRDYSQCLYSMCLVSRRFLSLAQPLLHHAFLYGYGDSWRSDAFSWDRRLSAFLHTLLRRRDLAASVRRIYVHPFLRRYVEPDEASLALKDAAHILDKLDVAEYTALFQAMLQESMGLETDALGLLAFVLALVPNLDRLSLQVAEHRGGIPVQAFQNLAPIVPGPGLLSRLKTLDICCRSAEAQLFSLSHNASGILETAAHSLETLNLHMCGEFELRIGEDTLHLRHLRITQSKLMDEDFRTLLSACAPGLETFTYEASYPYIVFGPPCGFEPFVESVNSCQPTDSLLRPLFKFRATLKSLHLDLRCRQNMSLRYYSRAKWEGGWTQPLTGTDTLASFEALEDVFISTCSICNPEEPVTADTTLLTRLLPPNIRALKLAGGKDGGAPDRLANALFHLAKTAATAQGGGPFGMLERVTCDASIAQEVDEMAVPELFATAGVYFGYESWSLSKSTLSPEDAPWENPLELSYRLDYIGESPSVPQPLL